LEKHKLSLQDQLKGVRSAIRSEKTPKQFLPGLKKRLKMLEKKIGG